MPEYEVTIQRASEGELSDLASWYSMIDPAMPDQPPEELNGRYVGALRSGVLGSSLEHGQESLDVMLEHADIDDQLMSRMLVLSARRGGRTVGMLVMGPPGGFYNGVMAQVASYPQRMIQQMHVAFLVGLCKLDVVAVVPEERRRGLGERLIRHALDVARKSAVERIYGEFYNDTGLAAFYEGLGFTVPGPGQSLLALADFPIQIRSAPSETPFQLTVGPPVRLF
ncbi:GNAT family N-acetyltransferase [Mycobacteroides abscessus]|uniref:GNAT family N-acetyltransferase n=1 Tax=Mycobacteroides abscessus TaxID=36809 RepID=UPI0009A8C64B|nr:GNAT family N-acetyltransferase [Mycobacteroides abscessus]SLD23386.1 Predicted acetyltransferase [Mycobacteroides abscessus subsp. massiliense]SLD41553.1 Predicted acetyltransferase [Mycobacteroides abscessus subsp. massiliense]